MDSLKKNRMDNAITKAMKIIASAYLKKNVVIDKYYRVASFLNPQIKSLKFATDQQKFETIRDTKDFIDNVVVDVAINRESERRRSTDSVNSILSSFLDDDIDVNEVDLYMSYKVSVSEEFHILQWWNSHKSTFPKLYQLMLLLYAIPATSAPSERKFSLAGNIINCLRASMNPEKLEDLLILHSNANDELNLTDNNTTEN